MSVVHGQLSTANRRASCCIVSSCDHHSFIWIRFLLEISMVKWLNLCFVPMRFGVRIRVTTSCSLVLFFFSEIYGRHCLSYRVYALSDALGRKFAAQLRETLHMWGNLEYNEVSSIEKVLKSKYLARSCLESFFDSLPHPSCTIYTRDVLFVFCFIV